MNRRAWLPVLAVLTGLVALGALGLFLMDRSPDADPEAPGVAVRVQPPVQDTAWATMAYRGEVEGDGDVGLSFRIAGDLARMHVREGDEVAEGAMLAELDASELDGAIEKARAELDRARAEEAHWEGELEVEERLFDAGAVSESALKATRLSHRRAVLAREGAEGALAEVRARSEGSRIHAPRSGKVGRIEAREGEGVTPGMPVLTLVGGELRVRVDVLEADRERGIEPGTQVALPARDCAGHVTTVDAASRPPFGSVRVYVAPEDGCLDDRTPGSSVAVRFRIEGEGDALFVPFSAVDFRAGSPRVFRVTEDETAEAVPVTLGAQHGGVQEVSGPLSPDDRIVVTGAANLRDGDSVRVVEDGGLP